MRTRWSKQEMESILLQLNKQCYPFKEYTFLQHKNGLVKLGTGGFADIYEMKNQKGDRFALKVLGFGDKQMESDEFRESVRIQKNLARFSNDVVKVISYAEMRVYIDESCRVLDVIKLPELKKSNIAGNFLTLQFVLMEKLIPILSTDANGKPKLYPKALANFEEREIMKLAYNIGTALARAHEENTLHRDIKLENVFYDPKTKGYKLGDFGIAKQSSNGMASTVAFTKGYGAPEVVGAIDDKYDNTADIYSFGIMLYLLLNELKFPDSENYNVNVALQYSKGYVFPYPIHKEYDLCIVLGGMCVYDPEERYQSMEHVLNHIEECMHGREIGYKSKNIKSTYVIGAFFYAVGMALWKMTHMPELTLNIGWLEYAFLFLGGVNCWLVLKKKDSSLRILPWWLSLILGIVILVTTEFTWWKLVFILLVILFDGTFSGVMVYGVFCIDILSKIMQNYSQIYDNMRPYNWVAILFLFFSAGLFMEHFMIANRNEEMNKFYSKRNIFWVIWVLNGGIVVLFDITFRTMIDVESVVSVFDVPILKNFAWIVRNYNCMLLGLGNIVLGVGWVIREKVLSKMSVNIQ